jgi:hypothetical protein
VVDDLRAACMDLKTIGSWRFCMKIEKISPDHFFHFVKNRLVEILKIQILRSFKNGKTGKPKCMVNRKN